MSSPGCTRTATSCKWVSAGRTCPAASGRTSPLGRALLLNPQILLLDEPTSAMDNTGEERLKQRLQAVVEGKTVLLVTHRASLLSLVDRLIVIDRGQIVADGPKARSWMR